MKRYGLLAAILSTKRNGRLRPEDYAALQAKRLRGLFRHARAHSPYFKNLYRNVSEADFSLAQLPPTNKQDLMAGFDQWVTDPALTLADVNRFMENKDNIGRKLYGKYLVFTTSGSTGHPSVVLSDNTVFNVSAAISVLRAFARKEEMRAFLKRGKKAAGVYAADGFYLGGGTIRYNRLRRPKRRNQLLLHVLDPMDEIVRRLNEFQPAMLGSYPSTLELLAEEQRAGRLHISPALVMSGGEYLREDLRRELSQVFNCYAQTNYACTEAGIIACECAEGRLHINEDWCVIEAVDENDQPVPNGTQSDKVLMTNLANYTQPFIRYTITDRVIIHDGPCACGSPFRRLEVEGRNDEVLSFGNNVRVAPMQLFAVLKPIHEIKRYQIIKHTDRLELRLTAEDKAAAFIKAKLALDNYLTQRQVRADIYLSEVEPQVHPKSGKFKAVYEAQAGR